MSTDETPDASVRARLAARIRSARSSRFTRDAFTVFGGTVAAQVFPLAAAPILTRLYTPDDFGVFALFFSVAALVSVLATLRYNVAVVLPSDDQQAVHIAALALILSAGIGGVLLVAAVAFARPFSRLLGNEAFAPYAGWAVVCGVLLAAYSVNYAWLNRRRLFRRMALSRVAQSGGITLAQLALGALGTGSAGLVGGLVAGQVIGNALPAASVAGPLRGASVAGMKQQATRYRRFPQFSLPADFVNSATNQLPVVLMTSFFSSGVVGLYNLTTRVVAAPAQLLQTAVLDAFRERAARDYAETGSCRAIYVKTFAVLAVLGVVPALVLFAAGPALFGIVFGPEWREAGQYARLLVPWFYLGFVASPLGYTLYVAERQHIDLAWQVALFVCTNAAVVAGGLLGSPRTAILYFSLSYSAMYAVYLVMSYRASGPVRPADDASR